MKLETMPFVLNTSVYMDKFLLWTNFSKLYLILVFWFPLKVSLKIQNYLWLIFYLFRIFVGFYTPPHFSVGVLCYTFRCLSVRPSMLTISDQQLEYLFTEFFSNFAYILLSAMSGMGLLMAKIRPFLTELLPFFVLEKWFLACYSFTVHDIWMKLHRYVAHQRLHIVTKDRHSDLPSLWVIRPW